MNPARILRPDLATPNFAHLWVHLVGPFAGAYRRGGLPGRLLGAQDPDRQDLP